jgi:hypothetical protein
MTGMGTVPCIVRVSGVRPGVCIGRRATDLRRMRPVRVGRTRWHRELRVLRVPRLCRRGLGGRLAVMVV